MISTSAEIGQAEILREPKPSDRPQEGADRLLERGRELPRRPAVRVGHDDRGELVRQLRQARRDSRPGRGPFPPGLFGAHVLGTEPSQAGLAFVRQARGQAGLSRALALVQGRAGGEESLDGRPCVLPAGGGLEAGRVPAPERANTDPAGELPNRLGGHGGGVGAHRMAPGFARGRFVRARHSSERRASADPLLRMVFQGPSVKPRCSPTRLNTGPSSRLCPYCCSSFTVVRILAGSVADGIGAAVGDTTSSEVADSLSRRTPRGPRCPAGWSGGGV